MKFRNTVCSSMRPGRVRRVVNSMLLRPHLGLLAAVMGIAPSYSWSSSLEEHDHHRHNNVQTWEVSGRAVSGPNDVCGVPQWTMPAPFPPDAHFTVLGAHDDNPNALNSIPLTPELCGQDDVLLATYSNAGLNALGGFPDADQRIKNVPLREVQVKAFPDGTRLTLPSMDMTNGNPFPPTKSEPNDAITVDQWFAARGEMVFRCYPDGTAKIEARFRNLIPNGVYGLYATWLTIPPGEVNPTFVPLAFGGVPNMMIPDEKGRAHFKRTFSYCPMNNAPDGSFIMFINAGYHADGIPGGVMPQTILEQGKFTSEHGEVFFSAKPPGTVTIPHVQFPIGVQ